METVEWVGRPIPRDDLPLNLVNTYRGYSFDALVDKNGFAYDTIGEWARVTHTAMAAGNEVVRSLSDPDLVLQEMDYLKKMRVCWRDKGLGMLAMDHEVIVENKEQAKWLRHEMINLGMELAAAINAWPLEELITTMESAEVPIAKGKGAPYWISASDRQGALNLAAVAERSASVEQMLTLLGELGQARMPSVLTSYVRLAASGEKRTAYVLAGSELRSEGESYLPKARRIQALPLPMNWPLVPVANVLKKALNEVVPSTDGKVETAIAMCRKYRTCMASDMASYDETIGYETIQLFLEAIAVVLRVLVRLGAMTKAEAAMVVEVVERVQEMDLLSPPVRTDEAARLTRTKGANKSGIRLTSIIATFVNVCRIRAKGRQLRIPIGFAVFGDDTVIATHRTRKELFTSWFNPGFNNHGFVEEPADDTSFLMKRIPGGYAYLMRMLLSTINREVIHEPRNIFAAASGIKIRNSLLAGHPRQHAYYEILEECGGRLRDAKRLAEVSTQSDLLTAVAITIPKSNRGLADDATEAVDRSADAGLITEEQRRQLLAVLAPMNRMRIRKYGELKREARTVPLPVLEKYFRRVSYTIR
jgi:hypothetical protein